MASHADNTVTCHTLACDNADEPIKMASGNEMDTGEWVPIGTYFCGVCGHEITDITPVDA